MTPSGVVMELDTDWTSTWSNYDSKAGLVDLVPSWTTYEEVFFLGSPSRGSYQTVMSVPYPAGPFNASYGGPVATKFGVDYGDAVWMVESGIIYKWANNKWNMKFACGAVYDMAVNIDSVYILSDPTAGSSGHTLYSHPLNGGNWTRWPDPQ